MQFVLTRLFQFFGVLAAKRVVDSVLRFSAMKILMITIITITLPIILKNLINWLMTQVITLTQGINMDGLESFNTSIAGLAGWMGQHLMLADCISILFTAMAIRLVLNFIPFVG